MNGSCSLMLPRQILKLYCCIMAISYHQLKIRKLERALKMCYDQHKWLICKLSPDTCKWLLFYLVFGVDILSIVASNVNGTVIQKTCISKGLVNMADNSARGQKCKLSRTYRQIKLYYLYYTLILD